MLGVRLHQRLYIGYMRFLNTRRFAATFHLFASWSLTGSSIKAVSGLFLSTQILLWCYFARNSTFEELFYFVGWIKLASYEEAYCSWPRRQQRWWSSRLSAWFLFQATAMIKRIKESFKEILMEVSWLDDSTKQVAREKVCFLQLLTALTETSC